MKRLGEIIVWCILATVLVVKKHQGRKKQR